MKYRAIKDNAGRFAVKLMCSVTEISPSGYYAWLNRPESARAQANRRLLGGFARPTGAHAAVMVRITQELRAEGLCVGENHVAELMRAAQIRAKSARKWRATTKSSHRLPVAENTLNRAFNVTQPDRVWAGDSSCVITKRPIASDHPMLSLTPPRAEFLFLEPRWQKTSSRKCGS